MGSFSWTYAQDLQHQKHNDLHASPGSQNGFQHSSSRDGFIEWANPEHVSQSLEAIDYLASSYAKHPSLLGIELLNEPTASGVPLYILISYYSRGSFEHPSVFGIELLNEPTASGVPLDILISYYSRGSFELC